MPDIEIVDDSGDEFYVTDIPIPFYIRCKLEGEQVKYRVKLLDEVGNTRGYYTGTSNRDYLELHVPVIPLRKQGKLFIEIELYDTKLTQLSTRKTSIEYVDKEKYQKLKTTEKKEGYPEESQKMESETTTEEEKTPIQSSLPPNTQHEKDLTSSFELTNDEIAYLTQRSEILQETVESNIITEIKEISEIKSEEEE